MDKSIPIQEQRRVRAVLSGNKRVLRSLIKELEPKLKAYVSSRVANGKDGEEIVQDTLLAMLDALPLFGFQSTLWTFTISIAKHEIADYWRKRYAKKFIRAVPLIHSVYDHSLYSSAEISEDLNERVEKVYRTISPLYRKILIWKYEEGVSIKEIARRLKITAKAAESKLYRARVVFQDTYTQMFGPPQFAVLPWR